MDYKIKILIASVLKPADDVRSFYKIGHSLAQTNKYEVNIIGFNSKKNTKHKNIFLFSIFKFQRNSFKRLLAPFSILKIYLQLKPKLIIVNTPELLWLMYLIRIIFGTKIIYDIQENYRFNIQQNQIYKGISKSIVSLLIPVLENISKHFVDGFLIAENIYEEQLNFIHKKPYIKLLNKTVLQNTQQIEPVNFIGNKPLKFIYCGTIGREYGTLEAIDFIKNLHKHTPKVTLTIIGYSPDRQYINLVQDKVEDFEYIELITDTKPIPQAKIITEIKHSDIALLPYQLNPNISGRFPTKIYDFLALGKPMVIPPHAQWKAYLDQYQAGICVDFHKYDIKSFLLELFATTFYKNRPQEEIQWHSQEDLLLGFIKKILSK